MLQTPTHPTYRDQAEARTQLRVSDTLGRPWVVEVERATNAPTGPLMPDRSASAWAGVEDFQIPPQRYVSLDGDTLRIDWGSWATDLRKLIDPRKRPEDYGRITAEQMASWRETLAYVERQS